MPQKIAIIGGGIAGLTSAYLLNNRYDVSLFESRSCLGGNAYTHTTRTGAKLDMGVAAFSSEGCPYFFKLMEKLNVKTRPSWNYALSLYDLNTLNGLYMTPNLKGLLAQKFALFKPSRIKAYLSFLKGLNLCIKRNKDGELDGLTFEELLQQTPEFYGEGKLLLVSGLCLITSMHGDQIMHAPATFMIGKMTVFSDYLRPNHMFSIRVMVNGTREYIGLMTECVKDKITLNARVKTVLRDETGVTLVFNDGERKTFDKVIMACNADHSLEILAHPSELEFELLSPWKYNTSHMVAHEDHSYFPNKNLIGGFVCLYRQDGKSFETSVTGTSWGVNKWLRNTNYLITQYANFPIRESLIDGQVELRTPVFDFAAVKTIKRLPELNENQNTYFCGAHFGYGVHEDAIRSAVNVAKLLEVDF